MCKPFGEIPANAGEQTLYILRNATSLETFGGLRFEFATLNKNGKDVAKPYVNMQAGFLSVTGSDGDLVDVHRLGLGVRDVKGQFQGSHLEVGFGIDDVFQTHSHRRLFVDGLLSFKVAAIKAARPFVELTVDSDLGRGSDAVQTYLGFDLDLGCQVGHCPGSE